MKKGLVLQILALAIAALSGLTSVSILTKSLDADSLAFVLKLFFLFSFHSLFDGLRSSATLNLKNAECCLYEYCIKAKKIGAFATIVVSTFAYLFDFLDNVLILLITCSSFIFYLQSSMCWAGLDSKHRLGVAQLIRAISLASAYLMATISAVNGFSQYITAVIFPLTWGMSFILSKNLVSELYKIRCPRKKFLLSHDRASLTFTILASVLNFADRSILGVFSNNYNYAIYASQYEYAYRTNMLGGNFSMLLYPFLLNKTRRYGYKFCLDAQSVILFLLMVLLYASAVYRYELFSVLLNVDLVKYWYVFHAVCLAVMLNLLGQIFAPLQRASGDFKTSMIAYGLSVGISVPISIFLIWKYGLLGVSLSVMLLRLGDIFIFLSASFENLDTEGVSNMIIVSGIFLSSFIGIYYNMIGRDFENVILLSLIFTILNLLFRAYRGYWRAYPDT
jgi:O-antigen/teichoic acid export membrane protein